MAWTIILCLIIIRVMLRILQILLHKPYKLMCHQLYKKLIQTYIYYVI